jgi:hypothetical protein
MLIDTNLITIDGKVIRADKDIVILAQLLNQYNAFSSITIEETNEYEGYKYRVVNGEARFKACTLNKVSEIECKVKNGSLRSGKISSTTVQRSKRKL